jgi:hypothetical protein
LPGTPVADLRWLLERLAHGETLRIHCGGGDIARADGAWSRDRFFASGLATGDLEFQDGRLVPSSFPYEGEIRGAAAPELYRTRRAFSPEVAALKGYRIPLVPGSYEVALHFAEKVHEASGKRVFDVLLEGRRVLEQHDLFARSGLAAADVERLSGVRVDDGFLEIELAARVGQPEISGIEVRTVTSR